MGAMEKFAGFIDTVAGLTDARDRDALEYTLASVMFELTDATSLSMWCVKPSAGGGVRLSCCVSLGSARCAPLNDPRGALRSCGNKPQACEAELLACYETKRHSRSRIAASGLWRHVFPVANGHGVIRVVEILRDEPIREEEEPLVFGLLRIYRNHLGILQYSDCDDLTGLLNRRTFDDTFRALVAPRRDLRENSPFARNRAADELHSLHLAVIDIDFFKRVNDVFGHPYGDEVLVLLARLLTEGFRESDRLFRFGGEEFLALLPNTDALEARAALERFRESVENFHFPQVGRVTVSIGYTVVRPGDSGAGAFGRADQALYFAKHHGRNQVRGHEDLLASGALLSRDKQALEVEMF